MAIFLLNYNIILLLDCAKYMPNNGKPCIQNIAGFRYSAGSLWLDDPTAGVQACFRWQDKPLDGDLACPFLIHMWWLAWAGVFFPEPRVEFVGPSLTCARFSLYVQ